MCSTFEELFGDGAHSDDKALIAALGYIGDKKIIILAQEKGRNTTERARCNFGMMHPEGYRKAIRILNIASRFNIPVLSLIDTKGAHPSKRAEERGQARLIAHSMATMLNLQVPSIGVLIGEACSGGALGLALTDTLAMLENAYYTVISPESCSTILWGDKTHSDQCATALKMGVEEMLQYNIIDHCIEEPPGGAQTDRTLIYSRVKHYILDQYNSLMQQEIKTLQKARLQKYRTITQGLYL